MNKAKYFPALALTLLLFCTLLPAHALPADFHAPNSVLAQGRWARVKVTRDGMHLVSNAELRKLGFDDPSTVRVYGRGGRQLPLGLHESMDDDLPMLPSVKTAQGIVFFAADHFTWTKGKNLPLTHSIHPYSDDSYYFLSDSGRGSRLEPEPATMPGCSGTPLTSFPQRLVHEVESEPMADSGSQNFGEDFRAKSSQTFTFALDGFTGGDVGANIRFAAKTSSGSSSLMISANGKRLPSTANDKISATGSYCQIAETPKTISGLNPGDNLRLQIDFSYTGVLHLARLDFIEISYPRALSMSKEGLHFYDVYIPGEGVSISGCTSSTVIWDVTRPEAPVEVEYSLRGNQAEFTVTSGGVREFVAFNPADISLEAKSDMNVVANQDIHGLEIPDLVIITLPEYMAGAEKIAALHRNHDGMRVHILEPYQIFNEFSGGKTDIGAWRRMLKMWYDRGTDAEGHKLQHCLIMGKPHYDNKRISASARNCGYTPMPIFESYTGYEESQSYCNDDWISLLEDVSDSKFTMNSNKQCIGVGRLPVTTAREALDIAAKIEDYALRPSMGAWRNKIMMIADDGDLGNHLTQAQKVISNMTDHDGSSVVFDRVYLDATDLVMTSVGATYPQAKERMMRNWKDGVFFTDYIGHASPTSWGHEHLWTWPEMQAMDCPNPTFIMAATCSFSYWDRPEKSGSEVILLLPNGGAIGLISSVRTSYVDQNGELNFSLGKVLMTRDEDGLPLRFGDVLRKIKNGKSAASNDLRYVLLGDPALRLPGGSHIVTLDRIGETDMTSPEIEETGLYPELTACSQVKLSGRVTDPAGNTDTGFNGTVNVQLFDAERVVTTHGNGSGGRVCTYNDRDKRLAVVNAEVKGGIWETLLNVPPEIRGNFSPALIACYACSDAGQEGTGSTDHLYVYGYNDQQTADTEGPAIEAFYVNRPDFESGGVVNSEPVVFARLHDESGINVSETGIGHSLTLTIDGNDYRNDLNAYYTPTKGDPCSGMLAYPLGGLAPGRHKLTLTAWDNVNNVSTAEIELNAGTVTDPAIHGITALHNETSGMLEITVDLDRPNTAFDCETGIFSLSGERIWSETRQCTSDMQSTLTSSWNYCDRSGHRVQRGIYICRVRVETADGRYAVKSSKTAVAAAQ